MSDEEEIVIRRAVARLYRAFADERGSADWADGLDRLPPERERAPAENSVGGLSEEDFWYFAWHANTYAYQQGEGAIRYFLPRMCEHYAFDRHLTMAELLGKQARHHVDIEMMISLMRKENWRYWEREQVRAVEAWFLTMFRVSLGTRRKQSQTLHPRTDYVNRSATDWLGWAATAAMDLNPLLQAWAEDRSIPATVELAYALKYHAPDLQRCAGLFRWDGWENDGAPPAQVRQFVLWLMRPQTRTRLVDAFFACQDCPERATLLSEAEFEFDQIDAAWREPNETGWPEWVREYLAANPQARADVNRQG